MVLNLTGEFLLATEGMFSPAAMGGYVATAILALIGLFVTVWIFKRFLFKPLAKVVRERREEVDAVYKEQEQKAAELTRRAAELELQENTCQQERQEDLVVYEKQLAEERERILAQAQEKAERLLQTAAEECAHNQARTEAKLQREAVDLAVSALEALTATKATAADREFMREHIVAEMPSEKTEEPQS